MADEKSTDRSRQIARDNASPGAGISSFFYLSLFFSSLVMREKNELAHAREMNRSISARVYKRSIWHNLPGKSRFFFFLFSSLGKREEEDSL